MTFEDLELRPELLRAVSELGFVEPMPVQQRVIPFLLSSDPRDLVALAETGSGKTAAYGLPILNSIEPGAHHIQALVLCPTRELCMQICRDLGRYGQYMNRFRAVPVYGGENIVIQYKQLDDQPDVLVATPGRLVDLINRGKVHLDRVSLLVLDEADEMLDMGFKDDLETVLSEIPGEHRTLLFSATMPPEIARIANNYMHDHEEITIGQRNAGTENVEHIYYMVRADDRYLALKRIVDMNPDIYAIVFCRTRQETKEVADKLIRDGYNADALHGDLTQAQRDTVMGRFRERSLQVLVATDVAARGLDVSDLTHVINYNLPDDVEVYTHRSGRTGRAGKRGISCAIIHSREQGRIRQIERILKRQFERRQVPTGPEICKRQLFHTIAKMEQAEVNQEEIEQFMPEVMAKLSYLGKEEIIARFVSLEFNRFANYYKDAADINIKPREGKESGERRERRDYKERRADKPRNEFIEKKKRESKAKRQSGHKVRLKMYLGSKQNATPRTILGIINNYTQDRTIFVGDIEITPKATFFDVYEDQAEQVLKAFQGSKGRGLRVEKA